MERIVIYDFSQVDEKAQKEEVEWLFESARISSNHATLYIEDQDELDEYLGVLSEFEDNSEFEVHLRNRLRTEYRIYFSKKKYGFDLDAVERFGVGREGLEMKYLDQINSIDTLFIIVKDSTIIDKYFNDDIQNNDKNIEIHHYEKFEMTRVEVLYKKDMEFVWSRLREDVGIVNEHDMYDIDEWTSATKQDLLRYFRSRRLRNFNKNKFIYLAFASFRDRPLQTEPEDKLETFLRGHDENIDTEAPIDYISYFEHYVDELDERESMYQRQLAEVNQVKEKHSQEREELQASKPIDYKPFLKSSKTNADDLKTNKSKELIDMFFKPFYMLRRGL